MSLITTHVLDTAAGVPAAGVGIVLAAADGGATLAEVAGAVVAHGSTDADGRAALGPDDLEPGDYTLTFLTGEYFAASAIATLYPYVTVAFTVPTDQPPAHLHIPLLLSPFAYSTYRGS